VGPGGVPFMFHTATVKDMFVTLAERGSFINFFAEYVLEPYKITEFMLYSGFVNLKHQSQAALYHEYQYYGAVNLADWQVSEFDAAINRMKSNNTLTASVQGRAYPHLTEQQLDHWCNFLLSRSLVSDPKEAKNKLNILR
jgi:hypothetical protein